jgi:hypothetical protein
MASVKFGKDSREWALFRDFWKLCQDYWNVEYDNNVYLTQMIDDFKDLSNNRYKDIPFAVHLSVAFMDYVDRQIKSHGVMGDNA